MSKEHNVSPESVEIENISIKAGSKKGDGFACEIAAVQFEATFNGQKLEKNYIAKYAPDGHRGEMLKFVNKLILMFCPLNVQVSLAFVAEKIILNNTKSNLSGN